MYSDQQKNFFHTFLCFFFHISDSHCPVNGTIIIITIITYTMTIKFCHSLSFTYEGSFSLHVIPYITQNMSLFPL